MPTAACPQVNPTGHVAMLADHRSPCRAWQASHDNEEAAGEAMSGEDDTDVPSWDPKYTDQDVVDGSSAAAGQESSTKGPKTRSSTIRRGSRPQEWLNTSGGKKGQVSNKHLWVQHPPAALGTTRIGAIL